MQVEEKFPPTEYPRQRRNNWTWIILFAYILLAGAYFRFVGMDWDNNQHVHPDERFLTMVASSIQPVENLKDYFNTDISTLNPHNVGYGFYVYGTLPLFIVRYVGEAIGQAGYGDIYLVGRTISAAADLLSVVLAFLIALKLYQSTRLALIGAAFTSFAVLQIQLSHFFTVDTVANFFTYLALYCAVLVMTGGFKPKSETVSDLDTPEFDEWFKLSWRSFGSYAAFGIALGLAVASKVSTAAIAVMLPLAAYLGWLKIKNGKERGEHLAIILRNLVLAAVIALIVFRIFQPYAFTGPGFLDVKINPKWWANLKELQAQSTGDVDFPPALQWARRPVWFGWQNLTVWGLGLPLGLLSWAGFLWMGIRMLRGELRQHLFLWAWTGIYFYWQGTGFVSSMRYLLPIYPSMAIIAAWGLMSLWGWKTGMKDEETVTRASIPSEEDDLDELLPLEDVETIVAPAEALPEKRRGGFRKTAAFLVALIAIVGTFAWAFAFTRIYTRTESRTAASEWIYQNIPGAINIQVNTDDGSVVNHPLAMYAGVSIEPADPVMMAFTPELSGTLTDVTLTGVVDIRPAVDTLNQRLPRTIMVTVLGGEGQTLGYGLSSVLLIDDQPRKVTLETPISVVKGEPYTLRLEVVEPDAALSIFGGISLTIQTPERIASQLLPDPLQTIRPEHDFLLSSFHFQTSGSVERIYLNRVVDWENQPGSKKLEISLFNEGESTPVTVGEVTAEFRAGSDPRGDGYWVDLATPVMVNKDQNYSLQIKLIEGDGAIAIYSSKPAIETTWDMTVPFDLGMGNAFDTYAGIYRTELIFENYWDDNAEKREKMFATLDQADYILSSTNRVWGTVPRVPERYPLTTEFYRLLLGCPPEKDVVWCYNTAEVGTFNGQLGFDLVNVTTSYPNLGTIEFNTQFAEEAFSVYDHPKVMVFRKSENYDPDRVRKQLEAVDLSKAIHITPRQASKYNGLLTLPVVRWAQQQAGGTWLELFDRFVFFNQKPVWALVIWYLSVTILGWVVYPFVRMSLHGLKDKGYPFSKLAGMLILAWITWLAGSAGISVTRGTISIVIVALALVNFLLFLWQKAEILAEWREKRRYFLWVEIASLGFFLFFVLIRLGNPDLWHPAKGGEKPMDFSYLNAVIKSTTYPPYDPWYAGGYINYYYYGFVIVGVLVKWLGIIPSIAYNLILPTLYSFTAMGAFSVAWNLVTGIPKQLTPPTETGEEGEKPPADRKAWFRSPWFAGLSGAGLVAVVGNLGTVRMIWQGMQRLSLPQGIATVEDGSFFQKIGWGLSGLLKYVQGASLPYGWGDWYWNPSRELPGNTITEFPFFTFLYADLHAHMIALPITILAFAWALSVLQGQWKWGAIKKHKWVGFVASMSLAGIVIGALRPTNTWDLPAYLVLAIVAIIYTGLRYAELPVQLLRLDKRFGRVLIALGSVILLTALVFVFYHPFAKWYAQGYSSISLWKEAEQAPVNSFLNHWGLFFFIILSWMWQETIAWMAATPVSALRKLNPYRTTILFAGLAIIITIVVLMVVEAVQIAWIVIPAALWAGILLFRPGQPDSKRIVLFLTGSAFVITLFVEVFVLVGDIGRMNTVFKFYMQAWTMFAISSAAGLYWLMPAVQFEWRSGWSRTWQTVLALLVGGALLFPLLAGADKVRDRMSTATPRTLDGMAYMQTAKYNENGVDLDLSEDYRAILWMQDNVAGSPVIVEAKTGEYRWGTRFTIYTGLPGVVGWNWHQIQQRSTLPGNWVSDRIEEIRVFYTTTDILQAQNFLEKYDVKYIIVGQLEQAIYPGDGLLKFSQYEGEAWNIVYRDGNTSIYEVLP